MRILGQRHQQHSGERLVAPRQPHDLGQFCLVCIIAAHPHCWARCRLPSESGVAAAAGDCAQLLFASGCGAAPDCLAAAVWVSFSRLLLLLLYWLLHER